MSVSIESGKTYTLFGKKNTSGELNNANIKDKEDPRGLMIRVCKELMAKISESEEKTIELKVQMYEIRQELIHDLIMFDNLEALKSICLLNLMNE